MRLFNYIVFRVFLYFNNKDSELAMANTINFMALFEGSLLVPLFLIFNGITKVYTTPDNPNARMKYYIGIPLAIILIIANTKLLKRKLTNVSLEKLKMKYSKNEKQISIWFIFLTPIFFVFITSMIYGALNGTLRFPLFE
jgi:uncharacterized sodium:solute symporter family permease YidK